MKVLKLNSDQGTFDSVGPQHLAGSILKDRFTQIKCFKNVKVFNILSARSSLCNRISAKKRVYVFQLYLGFGLLETWNYVVWSNFIGLFFSRLTLYNKFSSTSVVYYNTLFICEATELFCGLWAKSNPPLNWIRQPYIE